jgi:hypothetical protein
MLDYISTSYLRSRRTILHDEPGATAVQERQADEFTSEMLLPARHGQAGAATWVSGNVRGRPRTP